MISQQTQQEYEAKERELLEELQELSGEMDDKVRMAILDYMNLVFGTGDETNEFWSNVLTPYVSQYYNYPMDDLLRAPRYLNALFFAFSKGFGLKIVKPQAA